MKRFVALLFLITLILSSVYSQEKKFALHKNQRAMKEEILKFVSIGNDINDVKK